MREYMSVHASKKEEERNKEKERERDRQSKSEWQKKKISKYKRVIPVFVFNFFTVAFRL